MKYSYETITIITFNLIYVSSSNLYHANWRVRGFGVFNIAFV